MMIELFIRVLLLLSLTAIGWLLGKNLKLDAKGISALLIYVISPFVIFYAIVQSPANWTYLKYSFVAFVMASTMAMFAMLFAKRIWHDGRINLFGFAGGTGNTGYFALPLVLAIFNENQIAIAIFIIIGITLYEFTIGYFMTAIGAMNMKESLIKVLKLPLIYAATLGIIFKFYQIPIDDIAASFLANFKGAYSVLGMMCIGITIAQFSKLAVDWTFAILSSFWKQAVYPCIALLIFAWLWPVNKETLQVIALMAATPMAANVVIISTNLDLHPEKAASAVMLSTLLALLSIPVALYVSLTLL
ncbi:AEC family transporter [Acinetobacter shaoyimingii]|uniref:AEC family transporter n=1 Tax=Acinetobacter shaoyimingii TaxID=2715164 RepID=A0A6G8RX51_9GAMM|nr:AEC family transporter [Acinetobacter shaoyimingii]QIO06522.1 AEC family transporter [Acinetobacter shaoyimingii]